MPQLKGALLESIQFVWLNILYTFPSMCQVHWQAEAQKTKAIKNVPTHRVNAPNIFTKHSYGILTLASSVIPTEDVKRISRIILAVLKKDFESTELVWMYVFL